MDDSVDLNDDPVVALNNPKDGQNAKPKIKFVANEEESS